MSNEYTHLIINDCRESKDSETGEIRIYADCTEVQPRTFTINITKQKADFLNTVRSLKGKRVMFPTREGSFNGRSFVGVGEGVIIPLPDPVDNTVKPASFIPQVDLGTRAASGFDASKPK